MLDSPRKNKARWDWSQIPPVRRILFDSVLHLTIIPAQRRGGRRLSAWTPSLDPAPRRAGARRLRAAWYTSRYRALLPFPYALVRVSQVRVPVRYCRGTSIAYRSTRSSFIENRIVPPHALRPCRGLARGMVHARRARRESLPREPSGAAGWRVRRAVALHVATRVCILPGRGRVGGPMAAPPHAIAHRRGTGPHCTLHSHARHRALLVAPRDRDFGPESEF